MFRIMTATKRQRLAVSLAEELVLVQMETYFEESGTEDDIMNLDNKGIYQEKDDGGFIVRDEYADKFKTALETINTIIESTFDGNLTPINLTL